MRHLSDLYGAQAAVFLSDGLGGLDLLAEQDASFAFRSDEMSVARWAFSTASPRAWTPTRSPERRHVLCPWRPQKRFSA